MLDVHRLFLFLFFFFCSRAYAHHNTHSLWCNHHTFTIAPSLWPTPSPVFLSLHNKVQQQREHIQQNVQYNLDGASTKHQTLSPLRFVDTSLSLYLSPSLPCIPQNGSGQCVSTYPPFIVCSSLFDRFRPRTFHVHGAKRTNQGSIYHRIFEFGWKREKGQWAVVDSADRKKRPLFAGQGPHMFILLALVFALRCSHPTQPVPTIAS